MIQRLKAVRLNPVNIQFGKFGRIRPPGEHAKCAVALVPPRAPGDLRHFGQGQAPLFLAIKFGQAGKGDMAHIHVQTHANGVGCDQIIDFARLIHGDLRIAGGGRQGAHDHGCPAARPTQHFRNCVNMLGGKGDNGGTRRQAR